MLPCCASAHAKLSTAAAWPAMMDLGFSLPCRPFLNPNAKFCWFPRLTRDDADPALVHTGLYRGYSVTLMRDVPSYGLYFVAYQVVTRWAQSLSNPPPAAAIPLLAGGYDHEGHSGPESWVMVSLGKQQSCGQLHMLQVDADSNNVSYTSLHLTHWLQHCPAGG